MLVQKIAMITAYDYSMARLVDTAGVDMVLVGDSLGMVIQGHPDVIQRLNRGYSYVMQRLCRGYAVLMQRL